MSNSTELLDGLTNSTLLQNLTDAVLSTASIPYRTTTPGSSTPPSSTSIPTSISTEVISSTISPDSAHTTAKSVAFISLVVFVVAVALIAKIVISHKKKRAELIGGSARWRISASSASSNSANNSSGGTTATYLPMGRGSTSRSLNQQQQPLTNGLDNPGPDRLDWERQFFDDSEATNPPRLVFR